jgi:hypothetical protein
MCDTLSLHDALPIFSVFAVIGLYLVPGKFREIF